jgi:hypothetical protein
MPQRDTLALRRCTRPPHHVMQLAGTLLTLVVDAWRYSSLGVRSPTALAAEPLFLRNQLALYRDRGVKRRRATRATRIALMMLVRWFD